jgi:hypothetical protein
MHEWFHFHIKYIISQINSENLIKSSKIQMQKSSQKSSIFSNIISCGTVLPHETYSD